MLKEIDIIQEIDFLKNSLTEFKNRKFIHKKVTYVENDLRECTTELNFLISIDRVENKLILGFSENQNYIPTDFPKIEKKIDGNITEIRIRSNDQPNIKFMSIDFNLGHLLFVDRLPNGIAIFKTNSRKESDSKILKQRWLFREDIVFV